MTKRTWVKTDLAYLAGLIDGEGCFQISDNGSGYLRPLVQIIMTDLPTIEWVASFWDVKITPFGNKRRASHHKPQYMVKLSGKRAAIFTTLILPYLKTKARQAQLVLDFVDLGTTSPLGERLIASRKSIKEQMHVFNDDRRAH